MMNYHKYQDIARDYIEEIEEGRMRLGADDEDTLRDIYESLNYCASIERDPETLDRFIYGIENLGCANIHDFDPLVDRLAVIRDNRIAQDLFTEIEWREQIKEQQRNWDYERAGLI